MATNVQRVQFFRLWGRAKASICEGYGLNPYIKEEERAARHKWIASNGGPRSGSINAVRAGKAYARLMLRTAVAAEDFTAAAYWEQDLARRWAWFMGALVRQLGEIAREPKPWAYVQGIFAHLHLPPRWEDIPEAELEHIWMMLDTHRRRLLKRDHGWVGTREGGGETLAFVAEAEYAYTRDGRLVMRRRAGVAERKAAREEEVLVGSEELGVRS